MDASVPRLAETFDGAAAAYDRIRPGYPMQIAENVAQSARLVPGCALLEIGCGTGQATALFADGPYNLTCIDIGARLVAMAQARFRGREGIRFQVISFEDFRASPGSFSLIFAATSFHWIDREVGMRKSAELLAPEGCLAILSNRPAPAEHGFFVEVQGHYRRHAPELMRPSQASPASEAPAPPGAERFTAVWSRVYPWQRTYTAAEYIELLSTYSDHIALPTERRQRLFDDIGALIRDKYAAGVVKTYNTTARLLRKLGPSL